MKFRDVVKKFGPVAQKLAFGAVLLGPAAAFADATYDVTGITAAAAAAGTAILAVGTAVVAGPKIAVKVWKWIGSAL